MNTMFLKPGYVVLRSCPTQIKAVVASGVAVTFFDRVQAIGGMNHFILPYRTSSSQSTPIFGGPAIVALWNLFEKHGCRREDLDVQLIGGGVNTSVCNYRPGISESNIKVAREILKKLGFTHWIEDVGGDRGRKLMFQTSTGETITAKVASLRARDWYPESAYAVDR
jgi:chemotaxis protein CheD